MHLFSVVVEMVGLMLVFLPASGLFTFLLLLLPALHMLMLFGGILKTDKCCDVKDLRRFKGDVAVWLAWTAVEAWLAGPVFGWLILVAYELRTRGDGWERVGFVSGMAVVRILMVSHLSYIAWKVSCESEQYTLSAEKIFACKYTDLPEGRLRTTEDRCAICLGDYEEDDAALLLPCQHLFHMRCISQWLCKADRCPMRCQAGLLELPNRSSHSTEEWEGTPASMTPPSPRSSGEGEVTVASLTGVCDEEIEVGEDSRIVSI